MGISNIHNLFNASVYIIMSLIYLGAQLKPKSEKLKSLSVFKMHLLVFRMLLIGIG